MNLGQQALKVHAQNQGKLATLVTTPVLSKKDLALVYTPGVAAVSLAIAEKKERQFKYTIKGHTVGVVTDGSAVLGLGNIGPQAALPVMEGKAALFKTFAGLDAFPICLDTQDPEEIIRTVRYLAPVFGGINLEDISAPRCFAIEEALQDLGIPVMHDDQHGTAVVVLAGLLNAAKVAGRKMADLKVVVNGAGAAGNAVTKMLAGQIADLIVLDSQGILSPKRPDLDPYKKQLVKITNKGGLAGNLMTAVTGADVFIGVSKPNLLFPEHIAVMNGRPIIFALANPTPEIMPEIARKAGAFIVATGRSDFPNQINNSLAFPGIFKGALAKRVPRITLKMKVAAAKAIAGLVKKPTSERIIPGPFERGLVEAVSTAVARAL